MNNVVINGCIVSGDLVAGRNIHVSSDGDKVILNGKTVYTSSEKQITIVVEGNVSGDVSVTAGEIKVEGSVEGDVKTSSGDVIALTIAGNASSMSGDISASTVGGSVETMSGDIKTR